MTVDGMIDRSVPEIREEIERKTRETLVLWLERWERGEVTARDAESALQTLWGVAAGLVSRDVMETLSDALSALAREADSFAQRRVFKFSHHVAIMELIERPVGVRIFGSHKPSRQIDCSQDDYPYARRKLAVEKLERWLEHNGYEEVTWER